MVGDPFYDGYQSWSWLLIVSLSTETGETEREERERIEQTGTVKSLSSAKQFFMPRTSYWQLLSPALTRTPPNLTHSPFSFSRPHSPILASSSSNPSSPPFALPEYHQATMTTPREFITSLPDSQIEKFKDTMTERTLYPRTSRAFSTSNFRLDMQGPARNHTCYNLQVQINRKQKKRGTTVAQCIAAQDATIDDIRDALLDSARHGSAERTAGSVPEVAFCSRQETGSASKKNRLPSK